MSTYEERLKGTQEFLSKFGTKTHEELVSLARYFDDDLKKIPEYVTSLGDELSEEVQKVKGLFLHARVELLLKAREESEHMQIQRRHRAEWRGK